MKEKKMVSIPCALILLLICPRPVHARVLYSRDGGNATLPCDGVRGQNCYSVSWYSTEDQWWFDGSKIWPDSPPDPAERLSLLPDCSLHITNVTTKDAGLYRCGNHQSGRSEDLLLHVLAGVLYSRDGGNATLPCDGVRGPNCYSVSWYSEEDGWGIFQKKIWPDSPPDRAERLSLLPDCSLHITNVTTEDAGRYRCRNLQSGRSELLLHVLAGVLYSRDGGDATLPCDGVRGPNCSSVSWYSEEDGWGIFQKKIWPDSPPDRAERLGLLPDCSLHITNVTTKDAGRYRCRNLQSGRSGDLLLRVLAGVLYSRDGGDATLPCDGVRGPNCYSVSWYSEEYGWGIFQKKIWPDSPPDRAERLGLLPDCSLHITNVTTKDAGRYRCRNLQSGRSGDLLLRVLAVPSPSESDMEAGGHVTLPCVLHTGTDCDWLVHPDINVSWVEVRGADLGTSTHYQTTRSSACSTTLTVNLTSPAPSSQWRCCVTAGGQVQLSSVLYTFGHGDSLSSVYVAVRIAATVGLFVALITFEIILKRLRPTLGQHWGQHGASTGANTGANKGPALGQHGANTGPRALCVFALFLSTYQATSAQQSDPCYNYTVLNDTWRATTNTDQSVLRCDGTQVGSPTVHWQGWYLLVHQDHSVRMPESCVPINRCSTHAPIWLNGSHPSPADGVVTRQMCGHWTNGCCHFQPPSIQVKACPGNYTVYEFVDPFHCYLAYCADFSSEGALPSVTKHVVGVRLQVSSAERLNETAVEEQILKPLRDLLRQRGVDVSGIRLRRLVEKQP
ncbi:hypothetical protein ACEWY4_002398 [Coilia grayii]|uniref:Ig-like domain-containing protein n=1 Tax=Coilia grayii TaxID=363190 RepID=A0ABD1KNE6_9TELE